MGDTLNSSMAGNAGEVAAGKVCPNIRDSGNSRNIQTINGAAKSNDAINTINTDETAMKSAVSTVSNLAGTVSATGSGTVINSNSLTKHLIIKPGNHISYQLHRHRSEIWTFISGRGRLILDGQEQLVTVGDVVKIAAGVKHGIMAMSPSTPSIGENGGDKTGEMTSSNVSDYALHIIEVQIGDELTEEDIERFDWPLSSEASGLAGTVGMEDVSSQNHQAGS